MTVALSLIILAQAAAVQPVESRNMELAGPSSTHPAPSLSAVDPSSSASASPRCAAADPSEVVVCGSRRNSYRIDRNVLAAERAAEAVPSREQVLDPQEQAQCIGPNCGGDFVPLVTVAIKVVKAAIDAASGEDWRQNFRTHPDEYSAYQEAKSKEDSGKVSFSVSAGTSH